MKLKNLRGSVPVSALAKLCGVTKETIRQVETGTRPPSNALLKAWLAQFDTSLEDEPDIVESVIAKRVETNKWVRETEELRNLASVNKPLSREALTQDLVGLLSDVTDLDDSAKEAYEYLVREKLAKHLG